MLTRIYARQGGRGESRPYFESAYALHPLYSGATLAEWTTGRAPAERPEGISMAFMTEPERAFARGLSDLFLANPFLPDWVSAQRRALGRDFVTAPPVWHAHPDPLDRNPNITALNARIETFARTLRDRLAAGADPGPDAGLYQDLSTYLLFATLEPELKRLIVDSDGAKTWSSYPRFTRDVRQRFDFPALGPPPDPAQLLALFFQIRRAFHFTHEYILGGSRSAVELRAAVWEAIFTRDMRRYVRSLYQRMHDITTLIVGPSGTGKELVARAIGHARFIPFDPATQRFVENFRGGFYPLNLSALSATLIESELFGHKKGAFTGAAEHRIGWLEVCPPLGTVFLDEIGETEAAVQVKLLRVLQTRTFQRVGDTQDRPFHGKIVAATNRSLAEAMQAGRFRSDLYYRLCSDVIETPTLAAQLRDTPEELGHLLRFLGRRIAGDEEAEAVAQETEAWITKHLGPDYPWPGNVRELEQCLRNVMIRGRYSPPRAASGGVRDELAGAFLGGAWTVEETVRRYCTLVFAQTGNYQETARRLGIDWRTVKEKVDRALLEQLTGHDVARREKT
jgi:DNA-binding NtrC family response regulator